MKTRAILFVSMFLLVACCAHAFELHQSILDRDLQQVRYSIQSEGISSGKEMAPSTEGAGKAADKPYKYKSPGKAFLMSALVPGLGQYYYGSRVKPWLFFGLDVATWSLYFKFHGEGNDLTDQFENYQRAHWSRQAYATYLERAYGDTSDANLTEREISHHLPTTETGQYFEMTGKYDQFAWGWDDATRNGLPLDQWGATTELRIVDKSTTPTSANRTHYEDLRHDANIKFDRATNMVMVGIANRLISGFEAYFTTRSRNRNAAGGSSDDFSQLHFETSLHSLNTRQDTPFLTAYFKF